MDNAGITLMPSVARHIIEELFKERATWKREALIGEVKRIHAERGGIAGSQDPSAVVTKALGYLQEDGKIRNQVYGVWTAVSNDNSVTTIEPFAESGNVASSDESSPTAEKEIGTGNESVYLYFNPNDRELASLKGTDVWECKIGRSGASEVVTRIRNQGTVTALSHPPIIGLIIRTHDSAALEKALHSSLRLIDAGVSDSPGSEWFITSPDRIAKWFALFESLLSELDASAYNHRAEQTVGREAR